MLYRTLNFLRVILPYWVLFFLILAAYGFMSNEDFKNSSQDVVTFKVSCSTVRSDPMGYPEYVYEHCRKITARR